jgi:hypothetical protein
VRTHLSRVSANVIAATHRLVQGLLYSAMIIGLAAAVDHDFHLAILQAGATHRDIGDQRHLLRAIID